MEEEQGRAINREGYKEKNRGGEKEENKTLENNGFSLPLTLTLCVCPPQTERWIDRNPKKTETEREREREMDR